MILRSIHTLACRRIALCVAAAALSAAPVEAVDLIGYVPDYRLRTNNPNLPPEQDPFTNYALNTLKPQLAMLDEVRYFGITVNSNGSLTTVEDDVHRGNMQKIQDLIATLPETQRPRLGITLGGFGASAGFPSAAASAATRATVADNIKDLMDEVGATSVDIDWEHPENATDRANYSLLMQRIKQEVGESGDVSATMTPQIFMPHGAFEGANAIDGVALMTYDIGFWGNDPNNPHNLEHSLPEYVEDSISAWTSSVGSAIPAKLDWYFTSWGNNVAPELLGVGLPFYGRDVIQDANPNDEDARTYSQLVTGGTTSDGNYFTYAGEQLWLPGLDLVEQRVEYAHEHNLRNIIMWELSQDLPPAHALSLLRRAYETNQSFLPVPGDYDGDRAVGISDYDLWKLTYGTTTGGNMRADGNLDGIIDGADYAFWRNLFVPAGGGGSIAVPEPSSVTIAVLAGGLFLLARRNSPRSRRA